MKSILRKASLALLTLFLPSCGGGDESEAPPITRERAQAIDGCDGSILTIGVGPGTEIPAVDAPTSEPPDFVTKRTWLTTPWGTETYRFGLGENFDTKAQSANIGDGPCQSGEPTTITGHFYLSKGYKEDVHSGDGAWRRVDSTTTQCDNLLPGDTHTETKNTVISQWITTPGIYNIVYCIDHPLDDHNNGGEHLERHESNNCSTEAVFEVTANQIENVPNVDFIATGLTFLQRPVYAGDSFRIGGWIKNQGTVNATADIRSSYTVSCNGTPAIQLADDGTPASSLAAGASAWEETIGLVTMPNVAGTCVLTLTADYLKNQPETDEGNNTTTLTVTLTTRPVPVARPDFVITAVGPAGGKMSFRAGTRIYPAMYVKNVGNANPTGGIHSAYFYMGPATGGAWVYITGDNTDAGQLCVGCQYREQYDGGMKIGTRGTYYFKGCADDNNSQPELNEANNCTVSGAVTIY